jgi:hypothetical protein
MIVTEHTVMSIGVNLRLKPIINVAFMRSLDPPKSPLIRGTLRNTLVPPLLRGTLRNTLVPPLIRGTLRNTLVPPLLRGVRGDLDFDTKSLLGEV